MSKRILLLLCVAVTAITSFSQTAEYSAKRLKATDSFFINGKWVKFIVTDSTLSSVTSRDLVSADAIKNFVLNRLAYAIKSGDTTAMLAGYARANVVLDSLAAVQSRIQSKLTKSDADTYYPAIQRMIDSLNAVQGRIQSKLTKSDADTYYPAIQRMIDSLTAVQSRIQGKLTKSDADTYYPAIQRMIDSLTAVQTRIQGKLTKSDADTYYPAIQRVLDSLTAMQSRIQTKQPLLGYTAENSANKATDFATVNNVLYPTVQAVSNYIQSALTGVLKDRGNYDASGNTFPASGGSGSGGAIKTGDMWYISVGGTLGGKAVTAGAWVRSLTDAPGQTAGNWAIADGGFGFVPENVANKSTNTSLGTSNTAYPSQNAVKTYVDNATANASNWNTAYNKRPSSASISSSTFTLTLGDGSTVTASIPAFNQNTSGNAATATNATYWGGGSSAPYTFTYSSNSTVNSYMMGLSPTGDWRPTTAAAVQSWLGLGSYAYRSSGLAELTGANFTGNVVGTGFRGTSMGINLDGSNTASAGPYFFWGNSANTRQWLSQLDASNNLGWWYYNGSAYLKYLTFGTDGGITTGSISSLGTIVAQSSQTAAIFNGGYYGNSGGDYHTIGYNVGFTSTGGQWNYVYNDYSSFLRFQQGGFQFFTAPAGTGVMSPLLRMTLGLTGDLTLHTGSYNGLATGLTGTATGLNIGGQSLLLGYSGSSLTSQRGNGTVAYEYAITTPQTGLFSAIDNSNSILTFNRHPGDYYSQLGFSSNGNIYYRRFSGNAINTSQGWDVVLTSANYSSYAMVGAGYSANQNLNTNSNVGFANVTAQHYTNATTSVTSNYTVADGIGVVFANASSGSFTVTLPTASSWTGRVIYVSQTNCGPLEGSVSISGCTNLTSLNRNRPGGVFTSNGSTWYCVSTAYLSTTVCD